MENQHRAISGYRELDAGEVAEMNKVKACAEQVRLVFHSVGQLPGVDQRAIAIARTEAQTAFMWAVRAIAQPTTF